MKNLIFILLFTLFTGAASAQDSSSKAYFDARVQLVNMLNGTEKPSYEKAIYTIENAWYNNQIRYSDFDSAINFHTHNIQRLYKANYNEAAIKEQPSLLTSKEQLLAQYQKALTNWAIYTYITQPTLYADNTKFFVHHKYNYSYADPMATNNWENTQVINLHNSKQGNCFALASMFKILADRLQSEAQLCTAPSHIYIAHEDEKGTMYNVELGSKNFPGTGMISAITYSTDQAIENNIAQRQLNTSQQVALALVYLAKGYQHKYNNYTDSFLLQCANAALQYDPKNLNALLLKAEWLENRLQTKNIAEIQATQDFQVYENLLAQLYNQGYREMPLEMKNNILKLYNKEKLPNVIANKERVIARRNDEAISATLSWGLFDERHTHKATERYGNTIFNTRTKKITAFATGQNLYNNYNFDPVVFAMNVDPMAHKFPHASPYNFVENNPITRIDPEGNEWVNAGQRHVDRLGKALIDNPNSKKLQREMKRAISVRDDINVVLQNLRKNDKDLYNYIDNLKVKLYGHEKNVKVEVDIDYRVSGKEGQVGQTSHTNSSNSISEYKNSSIETPYIPNRRNEVGFQITLYDGSDATLANESGDVMYFMEFNKEAVASGSDEGKSRSEYMKKGGAGEYSSRVEDKYIDRKKEAKANPESVGTRENPYPLPNSTTK